jgi:sulfur carrier protein ThiS
MQITVSFPGFAINGHGFDQCTLHVSEPTTVQLALERLCEQFGPVFRQNVLHIDGTIHPMIALLVNGENVALGSGLGTILADGDRLDILHIIAGGD